MSRLVIVLPFPRPPLRPNQRVHPHARADLTRLVRHAATQCAKAAHIPPQPRSAVTAAWFPPDRRRRDVSSLHMLSKAAIDGLVDAGLWPDDDPTHVVEDRHRIEAPDRQHPRIEIWIDTQEKP